MMLYCRDEMYKQYARHTHITAGKYVVKNIVAQILYKCVVISIYDVRIMLSRLLINFKY